MCAGASSHPASRPRRASRLLLGVNLMGSCGSPPPNAPPFHEPSASPLTEGPEGSASHDTTAREGGEGFERIHAVQGSGAASPRLGHEVTVEGVVVADFRASLGGFFVQEEDEDADADPRTSEGIFVRHASVALRVGDRARVTGLVAEHFASTELTQVSAVAVEGPTTLPTPGRIVFPLDGPGWLERFEGMRVVVPEPLYVTDTHDLGRYGEVLLSSRGRLVQGTQAAAPGAPAAAVEEENARGSIVLDDASRTENPDPVVYPAPALHYQNPLRIGTTVAGLTAVVEEAFDAYRLHPTEPPAFVATANPRPDPLVREGSLRVASFNVSNYFNGDGGGGGFPTARGASTREDFERQSAKLTAAILGLDADIVGLVEIENDGYGPRSAIHELVSRLDAQAPPGVDYAFVDPGVETIGDHEIAVALLYRPRVVTPIGAAAILERAIDPRFDDRLNRPPLVQTFEEARTGERITVAVNHLKSKGSPCPGDPDLGDGQGDCSRTRTRAAQAEIAWLGRDPTGSGDPDIVILGDLNAYAMEDPISSIRAAGYHSALDLRASTFGFDGRWGTLDYVLVSESLSPQLTSGAAWSIGADEPRLLGYETSSETPAQVERYYGAGPYRASDHDPVVADFRLGGVR